MDTQEYLEYCVAKWKKDSVSHNDGTVDFNISGIKTPPTKGICFLSNNYFSVRFFCIVTLIAFNYISFRRYELRFDVHAVHKTPIRNMVSEIAYVTY